MDFGVAFPRLAGHGKTPACNPMNKRASGLTLLALFLLGAPGRMPAPPPPTATSGAQPTCAEVAEDYPRYQQITKQAVQVNPELAMLCVGVSQKQVEAARAKDGPHANTAVLIYMNDPAAATFNAKAKSYPVGSVVVKQKMIEAYRDEHGDYGVHGSPQGVGGMIKRAAGFDPEHGDWEYFYFEGEVRSVSGAAFAYEKPRQIESGRIASCVGCHAAAKGTDYVFGTWADPGNPFGRPTELKLR